MTTEKARKAEKRNLLSSFFVALLIGLAYQEMIPPVRESVRASGITLGTFVLFSIFFLTSMRFFIGNQLHLLSESLARMPGNVWLYDLMVIIAQSVAFIFLGGICSLEANRSATIGFIEILIAIYVIDVIWIVSQWIIGKLKAKCKREFIPWAWGILNTVLVVLLVVLSIICDLYAGIGLICLFVLNLAAFVVDVILVDYYGAL